MIDLLRKTLLSGVAAIAIVMASATVFAECKDPEYPPRDSDFAEAFKDDLKEVSSKPDRSSPETSTIRPYRPGGRDEVRSDAAMGFSEGLGAILIGKKFGFVDTSGKLIIRPKFTNVSCFSEGLAAVKIGRKWGFVDKNGKIVIAPNFDFALSFHEGLALAKAGNLWGYINSSGVWVIEPKYEEAAGFSEGLARISFFDKDHVWMTNVEQKGRQRGAFIDKTGKIAIGPLDSADRDFNGGMAMVSRIVDYRDNVISQTYFIDKSGKELWKLRSAYLTWFSDDMIVIETERGGGTTGHYGKYSFLDREGKRPTTRTYDSLDGFSEGLSAARDGKLYGYIDKTGEFVIKPAFEGADSFSEGLAIVYKDGKKGFIDRTGKFVIEPRFDWVGYFSEGLAPVRIDGRYGYIDKTGKLLEISTHRGRK